MYNTYALSDRQQSQMVRCDTQYVSYGAYGLWQFVRNLSLRMELEKSPNPLLNWLINPHLNQQHNRQLNLVTILQLNWLLWQPNWYWLIHISINNILHNSFQYHINNSIDYSIDYAIDNPINMRSAGSVTVTCQLRTWICSCLRRCLFNCLRSRLESRAYTVAYVVAWVFTCAVACALSY